MVNQMHNESQKTWDGLKQPIRNCLSCRYQTSHKLPDDGTVCYKSPDDGVEGYTCRNNKFSGWEWDRVTK